MALWGTMRDLTFLWGVTKQRAGQIARDLDLPSIGTKRDRRVDLETALRRRPHTCSPQELARVCEEARKTHRAFLAAQFDADDEPDDLLVTPVESNDALAAKLAAASGQGAEQVRESLELNNDFRKARAEKMRIDVEKARLKMQQEAGALIEREAVRAAGHAIARVLSTTAASTTETLVAKLSMAADDTQMREIITYAMRSWMEDVRRGLEDLDVQ